MTRTFAVSAAFVVILLAGTIGMGLWSFFLTDPQVKRHVFLAHFYLGLGTALIVLLVHCLIFTYFLGTGRWVKEVTLAYRLPDEPWHKRTRELKRNAFPPSLFSMLIAIFTAAAGAGAQLQAWPWQVHAIGAALTVLINLWAIQVGYRCLRENAQVIQGVLDETERRRKQAGLPTSQEELAGDVV